MSLSLIAQAYDIEEDVDSESENCDRIQNGSGQHCKLQKFSRRPENRKRKGRSEKKRPLKELPAPNKNDLIEKKKRKKKDSASVNKNKNGRSPSKCEIEDEETAKILLSKPLPFTKCKIVINQKVDTDDEPGEGDLKFKTGWKKEGNEFVFYDVKLPSINPAPIIDVVTEQPPTTIPPTLKSSPEPELKEEVQVVSRKRGRQRKKRSKKEAVAQQNQIISSEVEENLKEKENGEPTTVERTTSERLAEKLDDAEEGNLFSKIVAPPKKKKSKVLKEVTPEVRVVYRCPYCLIEFADSSSLIKHLPAHSQPRNDDEREAAPTPVDKAKLDDKVSTEKLHEDPVTAAEDKSKLEERPPENVQNQKKSPSKRKRSSHQCTKCNYSCSGSKNLKKHMEVHSKTGKPFGCSQCPSHFSNKTGLNLHEFYKHPETKKEEKYNLETVEKRNDLEGCAEKAEFGKLTSNSEPSLDDISEPEANQEEIPDSRTVSELTKLLNLHKLKISAKTQEMLSEMKSCNVLVKRCDGVLKYFGVPPKPKNTTHDQPMRKTSKKDIAQSPAGSELSSSEEGTLFQCNRCPQAFPYQNELSRHIVLVHFRIPSRPNRKIHNRTIKKIVKFL